MRQRYKIINNMEQYCRCRRLVGKNRPATKEVRRILREIDTPMILLYIYILLL